MCFVNMQSLNQIHKEPVVHIPVTTKYVNMSLNDIN